jgi:outer membrane immunogenic protein
MVRAGVFGAAFGALVLLSAPVKAGDSTNWTGFYAGAHGGYVTGDVSVKDIDGGVAPGPFDYTADGAFGGGTVGINWQISSLVLGLEGDLGYMDLSGSKIIGASGGSPYHQDLTLDGGLYGVAAARAGFAFGNTLIYGKCGYAYFDGEGQQATTKTYYTPTATDAFTGWAYGGGIEQALGGGWSLKAEYLRFDLDTEGGMQEKTALAPVGEVDDGTLVGSKFHNEQTLDGVDTFKLGINYKFGGREPAPLK